MTDLPNNQLPGAEPEARDFGSWLTSRQEARDPGREALPHVKRWIALDTILSGCCGLALLVLLAAQLAGRYSPLHSLVVLGLGGLVALLALPCLMALAYAWLRDVCWRPLLALGLTCAMGAVATVGLLIEHEQRQMDLKHLRASGGVPNADLRRALDRGWLKVNELAVSVQWQPAQGE